MHTRWRARREPRVELTWETGDDAPCEWVIGDDRPGASDYEAAHSAVAPPLVYPLFETALRAAAGRTVDEHQQHVSELWARFAAVAADNPNAWSRQAYSPEEIRTVIARQPHGVLPVPEAHVRQHRRRPGRGACCCARTKPRAPPASPDDRMVFLHAAAEVHDHYFFSERWTLSDSPGIATAVGDALDAAGITLDDVARFDLYSCFPSAVQVAIARARNRRRRSAAAHGHGRAGVRRRAGEQLSDARDRADGRGTARRPRRASVAPPRSVGTSRSTRPACGRQRRPSTASGGSIPQRARPRSTRSRAASPRASWTVRSRSRRRPFPSNATVRRPSGSSRALTADGRRAMANVRDHDTLAGLMTEAHEGRTAHLSNDGATNTAVFD